MLRVYHLVQDTSLSEIQRAGANFVLTYTPPSMRGGPNPVKIPLHPDPGPEKLCNQMTDLMRTFQEEHGHEPGYVLYARQGSNVALAAFVWNPPGSCDIVPKFDFEE